MQSRMRLTTIQNHVRTRELAMFAILNALARARCTAPPAWHGFLVCHAGSLFTSGT